VVEKNQGRMGGGHVPRERFWLKFLGKKKDVAERGGKGTKEIETDKEVCVFRG